VHADLKPEHVLFRKAGSGFSVKLIDLDSGFLEQDPPVKEQEIEGDPAYLAPEAFLRMAGVETQLTCALDTFAFGALVHVIWTGKLPGFDCERWRYLYEASLDGADIRLKLPKEWHSAVSGMLSADPLKRPSDAEITALFAPDAPRAEKACTLNGLRRLMKA